MNGPRYDHAFVSLGARAVEPTPLPQNQSADLIVEGARQNNLKNISLRIRTIRSRPSPAYQDRGNPLSRSIRCSPKANGAMWNRSPPMPACFSIRSIGPMSIG